VRFTIERLRTLVLAAGVLLVGLLAVFLARGKLKNPLNLKELPQRLGVDIAADASGFTLDHSFGGHSRYRIHASKAVQFKDNHAILHDVKIELYGDDQSRVDRIEGAEFEYDKNDQTAKASGPVEITLMRPGQAPAVARKAQESKAPHEKAAKDKVKATPIAAAASSAERDEIHVETSGLTFDTRSGVATTAEHVDFSTVQGSGSSMGANYDSQKGFLVLDRAVELNTRRSGSTVSIHAQHAEFERESHLCRLHAATADYRGGQATAGDAKILFRDDGSAARLDAVNGFNLVTATGGHIAAPTGFMEFDEHNQPQHGHLEGGVKMDSTRLAEDGAAQRRMRGSSPAAELDFTPKGELRHVHLQRGVEMASEQLSDSADGPLRVNRTWKSPLADVEFRDNGKGQAEPATIHGVQGVVVTGESQRGKAAAEPSRLAADEVTGEFGPDSALSAMTGMGHASVEETNAAGTRQTSTGDRLEAHFAQERDAVGAGVNSGPGRSGTSQSGTGQSGAGQIQSAVLDGHVVLMQQPAPKPGAATPSPLRAWAGRAVYDGAGEWLHLTLSPRVEDGGMQMTAEKIDVSHASGDAFARGNVKATWLDSGPDKALGSEKAGEQSTAGNGGAGNGAAGARQGDLALGGKGPTHVVAAEAELHRAPDGDSVATFRGHARMWQQANSVAGPVIVLDRAKQTLVATSTDPAEPVKAVLLSTGGLEAGSRSSKPAGNASSRDSAGGEVLGKNSTGKGSPSKAGTPSVIRVRGGDLKYSDAEHKAVMRGGALGTVVAETPTATSFSDEAELLLLSPGNHAGKDDGSAQVDRMTARGHVVVTSGGRRGTGEQLVYTGETEEYVLTGTAAAPPRMTDPLRGNVTGAALIFHSRDDSVSIEGGGHRTTTETTTQK
jgi:lipopolysaccharide export system protein LptA